MIALDVASIVLSFGMFILTLIMAFVMILQLTKK